MHLPLIHKEVLYIAFQHIKQHNLIINFDLIDTIFDIDNIEVFLDRIELNENDMYVIFDYYSNNTYYDIIYYDDKEYYIHNELSMMLLINNGGLSQILKDYFKIYYTNYINDFIYSYNHPNQYLLLNHYSFDLCCIKIGRLYNKNEYIE